jgi:hypothetical protein
MLQARFIVKAVEKKLEMRCCCRPGSSASSCQMWTVQYSQLMLPVSLGAVAKHSTAFHHPN